MILRKYIILAVTRACRPRSASEVEVPAEGLDVLADDLIDQVGPPHRGERHAEV